MKNDCTQNGVRATITRQRGARLPLSEVVIILLVGTFAAAAQAQYDDDAPSPVPPRVDAEVGRGEKCAALTTGFADRYVKSFRAGHEVGLSDAVDAYRVDRPRCSDATTARELGRLTDAMGSAPKLKPAKGSTKLTGLVDRALAAKLPDRVTSAIEVITAGTTGPRKKLINDYGVGLGMIQRVSIVLRIKGSDACLELRGNWRVSTLEADQDEPEYIALDRMRGDALGWRNLSNFDFSDLTPAFAVACPAPKR